MKSSQSQGIAFYFWDLSLSSCCDCVHVGTTCIGKRSYACLTLTVSGCIKRKSAKGKGQTESCFLFVCLSIALAAATVRENNGN